MDLTALIEFTSPGSVIRVKRSPSGTEGDPWPGINGWAGSDYQNALDTLVTWNSTPPTGAAVRANIAAWQASFPTQEEKDENAAQAEFDDSRMLKAVAIWTAQKLSIPLATARNEIKAIYKGLP